MAQKLIFSPAVAGAVSAMTPKEVPMPGADSPVDRDEDQVPGKAPETPPTEPKPAPVQDPPAEPNPAPYVVRGAAHSKEN